MNASAINPKHFLWRTEGKVGVITLNRPERKNPLTFESYAELRDLFRSLQYAKDIKVVVVTGAGGNFCSGGDVHEIIGPLTKMDMPGLLAFTTMTGDLVKAMRACPQPIVAGIDGICVGAQPVTFAPPRRMSGMIGPTPRPLAPFTRTGSPRGSASSARRGARSPSPMARSTCCTWAMCVTCRRQPGRPTSSSSRSGLNQSLDESIFLSTKTRAPSLDPTSRCPLKASDRCRTP